MESAVGFYANKPLVVCCRQVLGRARRLKTRDNTSRRKLPGDVRVEGGSCLYRESFAAFLPDVAGMRRPLSITYDDESHMGARRSHLRGVVGDDWPLAGAEPGGGDARHGPLGGEGRRRVDEGRAVAKSGAHYARLAADQLLVHVQSHWGRRVGEAQRWAGEENAKRLRRGGFNNHKTTRTT